MSRIFTLTAEGWGAQTLEGERYCLRTTDGPTAASVLMPGERAAPAAPLLLHVREGEGAAGSGWALLGGAARALRNGEPVALGLALLRHRDELRMPGADPLYFSTEQLAAVEPYEREEAPRCPRCAQPIARGEPAVRCPGCGVLHHELPDRNCWTYLERCASCPQATALDAELAWTPEEL